jgi:hypothetical protein
MTAVGTNILVRLLTGDDPKQAAAARALITAEPIWIAKTVLLETCAEDEQSVADALALTAQGIELADAMHLSSRPAGAVFASFDESFIRRAKRASAAEVRIMGRAAPSC